MLETSAAVACPYCGEPFDIAIDCTAGSQSCIEDCPVCCRPIEIGIEIDYRGRLRAVSARREDD